MMDTENQILHSNQSTKTVTKNEFVTSTPNHSDLDIFQLVKEYNRSQEQKIKSIEDESRLADERYMEFAANSNDDSGDKTDVQRRVERVEQAKKLKKYPIYYDWVQALIKHNNELIRIIEKIHKGAVSYDLSPGKHKNCAQNAEPANHLFVFSVEDSQNKCLPMADFNSIFEQNLKLAAKNADLQKQIEKLELEKQSMEEAAVEARVLILEVAERHDIIVKLKNELNDMEQQLKQKDTHIQFKDEIIKELRQQRRSNLKCPHSLINKTKLDSIDKVVDLIRSVSRDISPDSKDCECYSDYYHEKENQTDISYVENVVQSVNSSINYAEQIEMQQSELEHLNRDLNKSQLKYEEIAAANVALEQQLKSIHSKHEFDYNSGSSHEVEKCVADINQSIDMASVQTFSTAVADKIHLANLIASLKSELATVNALLKSKEEDFAEVNAQRKRRINELLNANKRYNLMEQQYANDRETIKHLQDNLNTHSDTINKLEENQSLLKLQIADYQDKQKDYQKIIDENRKLDANVNVATTYPSPATASSTFSNNVSSSNNNSNCYCQQRFREDSIDILNENLHANFQENIKLSKFITLLRDENVELREKIIDTETDYVILNDSYKKFINITFQYENDLLEELALKSIEFDDGLSNANTYLEQAVVNGIQEKLFRMEMDYTKRMKIQEICYNKKIAELHKEIKNLTHAMDEPTGTDSNSVEHSPRSSLKELIQQIHQLQQIVREKDIVIRRNEISFNFKNESLSQKLGRLEKQIEQEKRLNENYASKIGDLENQLRLEREQSIQRDQTKQLNELTARNEEYLERLEKQSVELHRLNVKLKDSASINTQLNDELNEKTEQICQLHSENSRLSVEMNNLASELKNGQENENHLSRHLITERKNVESKMKALAKCEILLKKLGDKNTEISIENTRLHDELVKMKNHLSESQKHEDMLSQDLCSITALQKETQNYLRASNDKVHSLSIYERQFTELKKAHDQLVHEINIKCANIQQTEENFEKLQNSYDLLHTDFNNLLEIKEKAEITVKTAHEWQQEQKQRELLVNKKISMQTEHISTLLEDRQTLLAKNSEMLRDMLILRRELEKFKNMLPRASPQSFGSLFEQRSGNESSTITYPNMLRYCSDPQINDYEEYQQKLDHNIDGMTKELQRTREFWEYGINKTIQNG